VAIEAQAGARRFAGARGERAAGRALHPGAWLCWLLGGSASIFLTSNPLYLSLGFLAAVAVYLAAGASTKGRALQPFVLLGIAVALLSVPFNVLTGSAGATELARLPALRSPGWFGGVTFGGAITAEALVTAGGRALTIATLVVLAAAFNARIDHFRLLRLAPRALSQLMLPLTIAVMIVPQTVAHGRSVAEARRLRGWPERGVRMLPFLLLPVLRGALERSVQRAESLEARGFGRGAVAPDWWAPWVGALGVGLSAWGAFAHFYYGAGAVAAATMLAGVLVVGAVLVRSGGTGPNGLRRERWTTPDMLVAGTALLTLALVFLLRLSGAGDADYLAYPQVSAPAFHPAGAAAFLLLLAPAPFLSGDDS
jgi:energy-coupling factor transport system permease protein